jgi:hypothetical protein
MFQKAKLWILEQALKPAIDWMDGKKTATGAVSLLLWVLIYGVPAVRPDLGYVAIFGKQAQDFLTAAGLHLDTELLVQGLGLTLIGLAHKAQKYFAGEPAAAPNVIAINRDAQNK